MVEKMNNQKRDIKQNIILIGMNLVIGVLCLLFFGRAVSLIETIAYMCSEASVKVSQMERDATYDNFDNLIRDYYTNITNGVHANSEMKEYYGIARYYDAMFWHRAYMETGDQERALREQKKAEEAYAEMGDWNIMAETIGKILSLPGESTIK